MKKFFVASFVAAALCVLAGPGQALEADLFCQAANAVPIPCPVDANTVLKVAPVGGAGSGVTATISNSTIAVTDTFQAALALSTTRLGCLFQNQSASNVMYIFVGVIGGATKAKSLQIQPSSSYTCGNISGSVEQSAVNVTGTNPDAFVMWSW